MELFWIVVFLTLPLGLLWACQLVAVLGTIGPVVLAYAVGIVLGNLPGLAIPGEAAKLVYFLAILLALPLLLFNADIRTWLRTAGRGILAFGIAVLSAVLLTVTAILLFHDLPQRDVLGGMQLGAATGGTVNLNAVAVGLGLGPEAPIVRVMQLADILWGGIYLLFVIRIAKPLLARFLPAYVGNPKGTSEGQAKTARPNPKAYLRAFGLGVVAVGISLGVAMSGEIAAKALGWIQPVADGQETPLFFILLFVSLTTTGVALSLNPRVRREPAAVPLGDYFILVFIIAIGTEVRLNDLSTSNGEMLLFSAFIIYGAITMHYLLCRILRVDVDTAILASSAAILSPPLLPIVAEAIGNRQALLTALMTGVLGYAVGTYLGLLIAGLF